MELKVWVDGIKRVVCGVTDNTTCQDIVIALAQAMGRTGRFTLIEQWRDSERPLAPSECPLLALQKWGEFANEVNLLLYESGTKKKQKHAENEKIVPKAPDRFTHNFTPPIKTNEAVIRRSLTFSGGRNPETNTTSMNTIKRYEQQSHESVKKSEEVLGSVHEYQFSNSLSPLQEHVSSGGNASPGLNSMSNQNSTTSPQKQQQHRMRSASQERGLPLQDRRRPSPVPANSTHHFNKPSQPQMTYQIQNSSDPLPSQQTSILNNSLVNPNQQQHLNHVINKPSSNGLLKQPVSHTMNDPSTTSFSSAFALKQPWLSIPSSNSLETSRIPHSDIPKYTKIGQSSHKLETMEEYDLNSNFPDVVKETGPEHLIEEYHVPGRQDQGHGNYNNGRSWEEEERVKLLRLVTMQNERIKMQDSQLEIIDTEISSREQKLEDLKLELSHVTEEMSKMSKLAEVQIAELVNLGDGSLIQDMEAEKQNERDIKNEISLFRAQLEKCENDLKQFHFKVKNCNEDMEAEVEVLKTDEKRRKEEEIKLQTEVSELWKELDEQFKESEEKAKLLSKIEDDIKSATGNITQKSNDLLSLEKELQTENLKFFHIPQNTESPLKSGESNGEVVFKVLEGGGSQNIKPNKILSIPKTVIDITKKKNGVWV